jgi:hypothetical protein
MIAELHTIRRTHGPSIPPNFISTEHCLALALLHGGNEMDDEQQTKVRFETLSAEKIPFGKNNFLEVARKKAITDDGDSEFISVSRGYFLPDGSEKYKKSITIPDDPEIKTFVTEKINKL